jgi:hypothetical protein
MILNSWKEIASYLRCSVRTAQRLEQSGMPVRRPAGHSRSAVIAMSDEIDLWRQNSQNGLAAFPNIDPGSQELRACASTLRARIVECRERSEALRMRMRALRMPNLSA